MNAPPKNWLRGDSTQIAGTFARVVNYEFDLLEQHRCFAEKSLIAAEKSLDDRLAAGAKQLASQEQEDYYDRHYDEYIEVSQDFPKLQWYSQFLIVYSTFEHLLQRLCRVVQKRSKLNLSSKDLEGQGITRSRNYLVKVAGVLSPFETASWHRALLLADIRNAIAHRNGEIPAEPANAKSLYMRVSKLGGLTLKTYVAGQDEVEIILSPEFVQSAIAELKQVILDVAHFPLYKNDA